MKTQIEHINVVFSRFSCFFVHKNPETEAQRSFAQSALSYVTNRERMNCLRGTFSFNKIKYLETLISQFSQRK